MDLATQIHLKSQREALEFRLRELRADLDAAAISRVAAAGVGEHEVTDLKDQAEQRGAADLEDESERRDLEETELVLAALKRLDEGRYGDCQDCGEPIPWPRLQVQPAALRCASCQASHEHTRAR